MHRRQTSERSGVHGRIEIILLTAFASRNSRKNHPGYGKHMSNDSRLKSLPTVSPGPGEHCWQLAKLTAHT